MNIEIQVIHLIHAFASLIPAQFVIPILPDNSGNGAIFFFGKYFPFYLQTNRKAGVQMNFNDGLRPVLRVLSGSSKGDEGVLVILLMTPKRDEYFASHRRAIAEGTIEARDLFFIDPTQISILDPGRFNSGCGVISRSIILAGGIENSLIGDTKL